MASTIGHRGGLSGRFHGGWRTRTAVIVALAGSAALLLLATAASLPAPVYWAVSSIAIAAVLTVFVAGERAWDDMVTKARAEGVVSRATERGIPQRGLSAWREPSLDARRR